MAFLKVIDAVESSHWTKRGGLLRRTDLAHPAAAAAIVLCMAVAKVVPVERGTHNLPSKRIRFVSAGMLGNLSTDAKGLNSLTSQNSTLDGRIQSVEEYGTPPAAAQVHDFNDEDGVHFEDEHDYFMNMMHNPEEQSQREKRVGSLLADELQPGEFGIPSEIEIAKRRRMT